MVEDCSRFVGIIGIFLGEDFSSNDVTVCETEGDCNQLLISIFRYLQFIEICARLRFKDHQHNYSTIPEKIRNENEVTFHKKVTQASPLPQLR